ncbi:MAG: hypothetical protein ACK5OB_18245, partial [Pirellula sp.]
ANADFCEIVDITPSDKSGSSFTEFPDAPELTKFDRSDRKFVAVALKSGKKTPILNAVDSDWWAFRNTLAQHGVHLEFVCPGQFK